MYQDVNAVNTDQITGTCLAQERGSPVSVDEIRHNLHFSQRIGGYSE